MKSKPLCIIAGCGPGLGKSLCRTYSSQGYLIAAIGRNLDKLRSILSGMEGVYPYQCDLTESSDIIQTMSAITSDHGIPEVLIYNAGQGFSGSFQDSEASELEHSWKLNVLGFYNISKSVVPDMVKNHKGSIIVSGATASLRGSADFAAFCAAKSAQRSLAQSMSRSLSREGVHVATVIIDGIIDSERTRSYFSDKPDSFFLNPDAISGTYLYLSEQDKSSWTFEMDLRPYTEIYQV